MLIKILYQILSILEVLTGFQQWNTLEPMEKQFNHMKKVQLKKKTEVSIHLLTGLNQK